MDVFPTITEACGLELHDVDGKSLLPLIDNPDKPWDKAAYSLFPRGKKYMGCTVTDGKWRYTEWRNSETQEVLSTELYNHETTLVADKNLSGKSKYNTIETQMKNLLNKQFSATRKSFYK